jgi:WD40 repeat protein
MTLAMLWVLNVGFTGCVDHDLRAEIPQDPRPIGSNAWRTEGELVGWAGPDAVVIARDALIRVDPNGQPHRVLLDRPVIPGVGAVSADGRRVAVGDGNGDLAVVDLAGGPTRILASDGGVVVAVAFSQDGASLVALADAPRPPFQPGSPPTPPPSLPNKAILSAWRIDATAPTAVWTLAGCRPYGLAYDAEIVAACGDHLVRLWPDGTALRKVPVPANVVATRERMVAVADRTGLTQWVNGKKVLRSDHPGVTALTFAPSGALLVAVPGAIEVWKSGILASSIASPPVSAVATSTDGTVVAASSGSLLLRWDLSTGAALPGGTGHAGTIVAVAVSPDDARVASASADGDVRVHDRVTGGPLGVWWVEPPARITAVAIAGDQVAAIIGDRIRLWTVGHESGVDVAFPEVDGLEVLDGELRARHGAISYALSAAGLTDARAEPLASSRPPQFPVPVTAWAAAPAGFISGSLDGRLTWWARGSTP